MSEEVEKPQTDDTAARQIVVSPTTQPPAATTAVVGRSPPRQLSELPDDELAHLAEDLGLDSTKYRTHADLVNAIHDRREMIAEMNREAMLDVVRWGRRPVTINAGKEQIAQEIARIRSMRFAGLSHRGLLVLARLRGADADDADSVPTLVHKLKRQEGIFEKLNRKRRSWLGGLVASIVGENSGSTDYKYLPPAPGTGEGGPSTVGSVKPQSIKDEIEESGLFGGISNRIKKTADQYLNQKLDEVEARIDRKLDEIDRRLAEWRDKEIANRIRILKITLWASVIVGIVSLIYSYVSDYLLPHK